MPDEHPAHPDSHALDDWPIYGPQDGRITMLVLRLAHDHGMRLPDIEALIIAALESQLERSGQKRR